MRRLFQRTWGFRRPWGMILLAVVLVLLGLSLALPTFGFPNFNVVLGILAIAAGVLILFDR
jgi:hypothetical protein